MLISGILCILKLLCIGNCMLLIFLQKIILNKELLLFIIQVTSTKRIQ